MGKKEKLLEKARRSPANLSFGDLVFLAKLAGFEQKRQRGSHVIFKHPAYDARMNFQEVNGQAKEYQVKQLIDFIDEHKIEWE